MCKDIALAGKIDAEHRARQNLGHGAFCDDLFFLRHRAPNIRGDAHRSRVGLQGAAISSPHCSGDLEIACPCGNRQDYLRRYLAELFKRKRWQVFAKLLTFPPRARLAELIHGCKSITIKHRANVMRWFVWEWVVCEQAIHLVRALEQSIDQSD